jgi:hypothetical protein
MRKSLMHLAIHRLARQLDLQCMVSPAPVFLQIPPSSSMGPRPSLELDLELTRLRGHIILCVQGAANDRFVAILSEHWPQWREARQELNELPLASEKWGR